MEEWQKLHIDRNIPELVRNTVVGVDLLAILRSKNLISIEEKDQLSSIYLTPQSKAEKLYEILKTRIGGYEVLRTALEKTQQSGAVRILDGCQSNFKSYGSIKVDESKLLGEGCYNTMVYRGIHGKREVAVKVITCTHHFRDPPAAQREIDFLIELDSHENIIRYYTAENIGGKFYIALELCVTNLQTWVRDRQVPMDEKEIVLQSTKGLSYLHAKHIVHRDLKPANILLSSNMKVKIADFGLSKRMPRAEMAYTKHTCGVGTEGWMAPEILQYYLDNRELQLMPATDIFSLGCIMYFVLTSGEHPFGDHVRRNVNIIDGNHVIPDEIRNFIPQEALTLILKMISSDPSNRPSVSRVLSSDYLQQTLNESWHFSSMKEVNILILGETGVGKSTWINSFMTFLKYDSLEKAERGDLCTLIPCQFTVSENDYNEIQVSTGTDDNEDFQSGGSCTQSTKVHHIIVDNTKLRIIDTPGIGDTRGAEQDQINFENILATISNLEELHGICILLKPNECRLNVMFPYRIKELLKYLHRDASKNIVFCFTNSRWTFYKPGNTLPCIRKILREIRHVNINLNPTTIYCYDSEAYRYLAAIKNETKVSFDEEDRENASRSWTKSIMETQRMLKYLQQLSPHKITSTLNINQVRQLILKLDRPMLEIRRNIQISKVIVEDEIREMEKTKETIEQLKKRQMVNRTEIEVKRIPYPKIVCANIRCVKIWSVNNATTTEYNTCQERSNFTELRKDTIGHPNLLNCAVMSNGNCNMCGHSYQEHLNIWYESVQVVKQVIDITVKESVTKNQEVVALKARLIEAKNNEIAEYKYELNKIQESSGVFACFLETNAIIPYNDDMEEYINHLIREEEEKKSCGVNGRTLQNLKKNKESCIAQKIILEAEMKKGNVSSGGTVLHGTAEVQNLVKDLEKLKHSGKALKDAFDCVGTTTTMSRLQKLIRDFKDYLF